MSLLYLYQSNPSIFDKNDLIIMKPAKWCIIKPKVLSDKYCKYLLLSNTGVKIFAILSQNKIDKPIEVVSGYIQDNLEHITKGQVDLYNVEMRMKSKNNTSLSRIAFDPTLPPVSDSLDINNYVWYPSLRSTLNLHVHSGVLDYSPIVGRGDSVVYE